MKEIIVGVNEEGKRLDGFLKSYLPNASKGFIYKMLRKKNITLNDKKADGLEKLANEDSIKIFFSDETLMKFKGESAANGRADNLDAEKIDLSKYGDVSVLFENDHVLFASKPAGLLSQKADANDMSINDFLIDYLLKNKKITPESLDTYRPSICNRLDRNTSGMVICAKSLVGARCMNTMLSDRTLDKYYIAVVSGLIEKDSLLKGYLKKDTDLNKVDILKEDPKDSNYSYIETYFTPVNYNSDSDTTVLLVKLITGKPHQIRAHLSKTGHPIIGDSKYGGRKVKGIGRQLLHSYKISFPENMPDTLCDLSGKEFIAPLPAEFALFCSGGDLCLHGKQGD
ncbi:RluA family pseudouridine synthase [Butyrivibrio sp. INlla21]|uniref:RluA family pseudouridine synthase n=1 Tax=Butyrivibrio sp. INlla21 TaxID=1520811 RepID=UPI0008EEEA12|nr:RluA family pseudouridine synthase [Butyrivibrio sp. INlla21]SFU80343.1 23S rRNA pseudouridine955/2504/2580 synthase [Butyrivibrio sp. INlla21]